MKREDIRNVKVLPVTIRSTMYLHKSLSHNEIHSTACYEVTSNASYNFPEGFHEGAELDCPYRCS
jgi:hypothetical protein